MIIKKLFYGFALAFSMLTTLPFFKVHHFYKGINAYAVMFYPLVGLILGGILFLLFDTLNPWLNVNYLYVLCFVLWIVLTGALHLDGVADVLDALFVDKKERARVLKDPHMGAMGMIFTLVFILLKLAVFMQIQMLYLLPLLLMLSRFNASLAIFFFNYVPKQGMGTLAKQEFTISYFLVSSVIVFTLALLFDSMLVFGMFTVSIICLGAVFFFAKRYFGGFSGDLYGFLIEFTELGLLHFLMVYALI